MVISSIHVSIAATEIKRKALIWDESVAYTRDLNYEKMAFYVLFENKKLLCIFLLYLTFIKRQIYYMCQIVLPDTT